MIGEQIRKRRVEKKLSLSSLAQLANVSKTYLHSLERNAQKNPSLEIVKKIATVLDVSPAFLLNDLIIENKESIKEDNQPTKDEYPTNESTLNQIESFFHFTKNIEELDTKQLEYLRDFIEFTLWKRNQNS